MQQGEHYKCDCGAEIEVLSPCTCAQKQPAITCTCGMPMKVVSETRR